MAPKKQTTQKQRGRGRGSDNGKRAVPQTKADSDSKRPRTPSTTASPGAASSGSGSGNRCNTPPSARLVQPGTCGAGKKNMKMDAVADMPSVNSSHYVKLELALSRLNEHPLFEGIMDQDPLPILNVDNVEDSSDQGVQQPYDADDYTNAMVRTGTYRCAGNLAWIAMGWRPDPGVPVIASKLEQLSDFHFHEPTVRFPVQMVIAVPNADFDPLEHRGGLKCVTQCEYAHALILKIAYEIESGKSEEALKRWKQVLLTVPMVFEVLQSEQD